MKKIMFKKRIKVMKIPYLGIYLNLWLIRNRIDRIDDEIYNLIQKRLEYAALTRHYKNSIYDEHRESQVIERLKQKKILDDEVVGDIWEQIIKHGRKVQLEDDK
jgi:chorismate mutase